MPGTATFSRKNGNDRRASPREIDRASRSTAPVSERNHTGRSEIAHTGRPGETHKALFSDHGKHPRLFLKRRGWRRGQRETRDARDGVFVLSGFRHTSSHRLGCTRARGARTGRTRRAFPSLGNRPGTPRLVSRRRSLSHQTQAPPVVTSRGGTLHPRIRRLTGRRRGRSPRRQRRGRPPRACHRT